MSDGWNQSAAAWIAERGEAGDFGSRFVLDTPLPARIKGWGPDRPLDVGCGEGRFCRMMRAGGIHVVGIDPTAALLDAARACDPAGGYRQRRAEALDFPNGSFNLVVSCLTLIDIDNVDRAVPGMAQICGRAGRCLLRTSQAMPVLTGVGCGTPKTWCVSAWTISERTGAAC